MLLPDPAPWFGRDKKSPEFYRDLRIKTDTGLHEQLVGLITSIVPAAGRRPKVLDLGCGEGALSQRLFDLGYEVVSVDIDARQAKLAGPAFVPLDFNDRPAVERFTAAGQGELDLILAVETIEHVRSPWDFIEMCRRLSSPRTQLIVTTPNVSSWWSRFWFFLKGDLWSFGPESWRDPGHINPITLNEMTHLLADCGFECVRVLPAGRLPIIWAYNWKRLAISLFLLPWRLVMRGHKDGWVLCYHARPIA